MDLSSAFSIDCSTLYYKRKRILSFFCESQNLLYCFTGDEVWSRGFGKEDLDTGKVVDPYSIFDIGSVTKSFTATLLGILLSENG